MCYRTTEPGIPKAMVDAPVQRAGRVLDTCVMNGKRDEMTGAVLEHDGEAQPLYNVWESVLGWARGEPIVEQSVGINETSALMQQLRLKGAENEPARITAAYTLGALCNSTLTDSGEQAAVALPIQPAAAAVATLADAMSHSWEGVRRAATHGLIAAGGHCCAAEQALLKLCVSAHSCLPPPGH
jgi:hypothetical protein